MVGPGLQYDKRVFNEMVSHYFPIMLDIKSVLSLYKIAQVINFYYMGGQTLPAAMETDGIWAYRVCVMTPLWNGGHKTTGEGLPSVDGEVVVHTDTYTVQLRRRVELQAKVEDLKRITWIYTGLI
ncbi:hypothetical protein J6590_104999 [Homalodisca vitripennis]|nr:hypothetical protein J6590_104999 [Homalodisca vitripennis]